MNELNQSPPRLSPEYWAAGEAADKTRSDIAAQVAEINELAPKSRANEIEALIREVARMRKQCEQHQIAEANLSHELSKFQMVDRNRGYNVFAAQDRHFIGEIYWLDEAITKAKRLAEAQGVDYVVVETAARATVSKTVTVEVIGK